LGCSFKQCANFVRNEITAGASVINGVTVTNTPVTNNILTATGPTTAAWTTTPFPSSAVVQVPAPTGVAATDQTNINNA